LSDEFWKKQEELNVGCLIRDVADCLPLKEGKGFITKLNGGVEISYLNGEVKSYILDILEHRTPVFSKPSESRKRLENENPEFMKELLDFYKKLFY